MSASVNSYLALVTAQHANKPKFMSMLQQLLHPFVDLQNFLESLPSAFDLDTAVGAQLDQTGAWIGRSRYIAVEVAGAYFSWDTLGLGWDQGYWQGAFSGGGGIVALDDDTYRAVLYAKVSSNNWDGAFGSALQLIPLPLVQGGGFLLDTYGQPVLDTSGQFMYSTAATRVQILDNQNMSMTVLITGVVPTPLVSAILTSGYVPQKPAGIQLTYVMMPTVGTTGLPMYLPNQVPH